MTQTYNINNKSYDLKEGYSIEKTTGKEFSIHFAVYNILENNIWFRQSFEKACSVIDDCDICYWVIKNGKKIGGVLIEPNYINCLTLIPPHNEFDLVITKLRDLLLIWSDEKKKIVVGGVKPNEFKYYEHAGFKAGISRRAMIRPTKHFEVEWENHLEIVNVGKEHMDALIDLFELAYFRDISNHLHDKETIISDLKFYFDNFGENNKLNNASSLIYDKRNNELIGACLISIWEDWPNVYEIVVKPENCGSGLATRMLKKSLSMLEKEYPVLRLFVTLGNDAERVYHNLGFLAGTETTEMALEVDYMI